jgi:hypothetical protein
LPRDEKQKLMSSMNSTKTMTIRNIRRKIRSIGPVAILFAVMMGCTSPVRPAGDTTVTTAGPVSPANGAQVPNLSQPVTLTVSNAVVTDPSAGVTYTFEVASDAGFANKVQTKDVPQGTGQTSVKLDALPPGQDYFWRVRTTSGTTVGAYTSGSKFTIGAAIVISAPSPISPANGASRTTWPTFTVTNATKSGPVGSVLYRFDISANSAFSPLLVTGTVAEGSGQTSFTPSQSAPSQPTQYFWRVTVTDQTSGVSSQPSSTQSFTFSPANSQAAKKAAEEGIELWPGAQPPGTVGKAKMGDSWEVQFVNSFGGTRFLSPLPEALRVFDLMDRGFEPQAAIDWMHANGYPVAGAFYPVAYGVIGFDFTYIAFNPITGAWDMILRSEGGL